MKASEFITELKKQSKPRNFVAKNAKMGGAGQHKNKKKAEKQGDTKHKNKEYAESIEEGWKDKVAAVGLAGAMALGASGANARVTPDGQGGYTGGFKPSATATAPSDNKSSAAEAPKGYSKEYLQKAADPNRFGRYMISVEKAQELLKNMSEGSLKELSTDKLAQYKKAAGADAKKADADGDYARGDKRFKGINKATNKQFDNDLKKHKQQGVAEGEKQLGIQQLATISDAALDKAYGYGRSTPGNTFGWQANLKSAAYAKQMIDKGVTDIEQISDAIHKGWNVTAKAFVQDPDQFDDTEKLKAAGKLEAKLQQREKLMNISYSQLPDDEQEKDRVVARALLQAMKGEE